jgi:hypothetical protein
VVLQTIGCFRRGCSVERRWIMKMIFNLHQLACRVQDRANTGRQLQRASLTLVAVMMVGAWIAPAHAVDEIQVYNAEIAKVGEWTVQQHLNYAINGRKVPDFPGGLVPHHALNGTPEFAYGITNWWEFGFYVPWAIDNRGNFHSDAAKIRTLFVTPDAEKREFFYGVNFEFAYSTRVFSETRFNAEIRPIIGWRKGDYELIVNPIVDVGFGSKGDVSFAPAARFAKKVVENFQVGIEYYTDLGPLQHFLPLKEQEHNVYAVVDFTVGGWDVNFGVGYGLTPGSDRLMTKLIVGTDLNNLLPGKALASAPSPARRTAEKP